MREPPLNLQTRNSQHRFFQGYESRFKRDYDKVQGLNCGSTDYCSKNTEAYRVDTKQFRLMTVPNGGTGEPHRVQTSIGPSDICERYLESCR